MASTKQKIPGAALKLFNENGLINVRLQHIADEAFVSIGNMAYHYENKEAIVMALYIKLAKRQKELLAEYLTVPLFDYMDRLFSRIFALQQEYIFYYLDALEIARAYPEIAEVHRQQIDWRVSQLKTMIDFNVSRGALIAEPLASIYEKLSVQIWMTIDFWPIQRMVRAEVVEDEQGYKAAIWALLFPYFTKMGEMEYQQMLNAPNGF
ncbi:MAG: hypothetical protein DHS20C18_28090 [Saprospiraceae bacterium]|nr:MAG: hypothetical protein DHS20C18_28090 [Saprospiraceae bacterium]